MFFTQINSHERPSGLAQQPNPVGIKRRALLPALIDRATEWREVSLLRQALALAGQPNSILDIPCGTGRLWPILFEKSNRLLIGADDCAEMLAVAAARFSEVGNERVLYLQTIPEAIDLQDCAVDSIFCVRLFSHVGCASYRQRLLREFHRVSRDTLILSLWVDGNLQSWRRQGDRRRAVPEPSHQARHVVPRQRIEAEFTAAGFDRLGHLDMFPRYHMTRTYVLRKR